MAVLDDFISECHLHLVNGKYELADVLDMAENERWAIEKNGNPKLHLSNLIVQTEKLLAK